MSLNRTQTTTQPDLEDSATTYRIKVPAANNDSFKREVKEYFFKMVRYRHMDWSLARLLVVNSLISPKKLY